MEIKLARSPKPCLFFIIPSLSGGGAERVIISLANHFSTLNYQSVIISLNKDEPAYAIATEVQVNYLLNRGKSKIRHRLYYAVKTFASLVQLLHKKKPACVLSFITSANVWAGIACSLKRIPYIVSERTSPNRGINQFNYLHKKLAAVLYARSAAVVVSAKGVENCLLNDKTFKNLNNIHQIMNAVAVFDKINPDRVHHRKFILGVGRLAFVKGFDLLIAAFSNAKLIDIDLIIIGEGEERANLVCQIYNLGLSKTVLLPGSRSNLQNYYSQAEMFVLPSRNEGYPNALVEAMSFGCACIAMNCDFGPEEIIENGINGLLIKTMSVNDLTDAMVFLANDPSYKNKLAVMALEINNTNSAKKVLGEWEKLVAKHAMNNSPEPLLLEA